MNVTTILTAPIQSFSSLARFYARFHGSCCSLLAIELFALIGFASRRSAGIFVAVLLFTLFTYVVLTVLLHTQREERLRALQATFPDASYALHMAIKLAEQEESLYSNRFPLCPILSEKLRNILYWKTFFRMRELSIQAGITHLVHRIQTNPLDSYLHIELANAYEQLAFLYLPSQSSLRWIPRAYTSSSMQKKCLHACERAIEELSIAQTQSPSIEICAKIGALYRLQGLNQKEIFSLQTLLQQDPSHAPSQFRLGLLYFMHGRHAEGLQLYALLHQTHPQEAKVLIEHYDSCTF